MSFPAIELAIISTVIILCGFMLWMIHDERKQARRRREHALRNKERRIDRIVEARIQQRALMEDNYG